MRRAAPLPHPREVVQQARRSWLAAAHDVLRHDPQAGQDTLRERWVAGLGDEVPPLPPALQVVLGRAEPAWAQLRLATLVPLLTGPFGERLGDVAPWAVLAPVPAIMVTQPDEVDDDPNDGPEAAAAFARLRRRQATAPEQTSAAEADGVAADQERAWLAHIIALLKLEIEVPRHWRAVPPQAAPRTVPPSLRCKLEEAGVAWKDTCVAELVALVVALELVA